jgi:hypothetical protein
MRHGYQTISTSEVYQQQIRVACLSLGKNCYPSRSRQYNWPRVFAALFEFAYNCLGRQNLSLTQSASLFLIRNCNVQHTWQVSLLEEIT